MFTRVALLCVLLLPRALSLSDRRALLQQATFANGAGTSATFSFPVGLAAVDASTLLIADAGNNAIRAITGNMYATTSAGSGIPALTSGTGTSASFYAPNGVALLDPTTAFVADSANNAVRSIRGPLLSVGSVVQTVAGTGVAGSSDGTSATFSDPCCYRVERKRRQATRLLYDDDDANAA